jgi:hypothetical protein
MYTHLPAGVSLTDNLQLSVEAFLYANICVPYNAAVAGTNYPAPLTQMLLDPDDENFEAKVPVIVFLEPYDVADVESTGMGDGYTWSWMEFPMMVYPAQSVDPSTGALYPEIKSATKLRSLFKGITTALTIPLYDFTVSPTSPVDYAYVTRARLRNIGGAGMTSLALEKHRFNFDLCLRFVQPNLNG